MSRLAGPIVAFRWPILAAWAAAIAASILFLPSIGEDRGAPLEGLVAADSPAVRAELRSARLFEVPVLTRTLVVQRDPNGLEPETEADALAAAFRVSTHREPRYQSVGLALPVTNTLEIVPESQETSTTVLTYLFFEPGAGLSDQTRIAERYADQFLSAGPGGFVGVTGAVPARLEQFDAIQGALPVVEFVTVALIALILSTTFRAPGAALAALAAAGAGYLVATRVVAWVAHEADFSVPREIEPLMLVLLLGIMTDYAIFFLSGFRQRLREGEERLPAARGTASDYLPIVATAGAVVAAGTAVLVVGRLDFFRAFGPGMGLTALIGALAAMTLVPALLAVFGRALYWPSIRASSPEAALTASPRGERRARRIAVSRVRAALVAAGVVLVLAAASTGLRDLRLGFTLIPGLPADA
jgi:RND superfamily putative drug exporter